MTKSVREDVNEESGSKKSELDSTADWDISMRGASGTCARLYASSSSSNKRASTEGWKK
jgi:hypothetical protein